MVHGDQAPPDRGARRVHAAGQLDIAWGYSYCCPAWVSGSKEFCVERVFAALWL
jgi:hypothetical protein